MCLKTKQFLAGLFLIRVLQQEIEFYFALLYLLTTALLILLIHIYIYIAPTMR
jgi:hypothetical protein